MMKTTLTLISLAFFSIGDGALAKGKFKKPEPKPPAPKVAVYEPPPKPNCSSDFAKSSEDFRDVLGKEASIENIKPFERKITVQGQNITTYNKLVQEGGQLYLKVKIAFFPDIDVPVQICNEDGKLSARLIMGAAMMKRAEGNVLLKASFTSVPDEMVLAVSRTDDKVNFKDDSKPNEPAAVADLNSNPVVAGAAQ